jgi:hypothetical protein
MTPTQQEDHARSYSERTKPNRSPDERKDGARSPSERRSFTTRTEGVDLDVDSPPDGDLPTGVDSSAASPPCSAPPLNLFEGQGQNPNQNQQGIHGREVKAAAMPGGDRPSPWRPAFLDDAGESNPNPNGNGLHKPPVFADPPLVDDTDFNCPDCLSSYGNPHEDNCSVTMRARGLMR